MACHRCNLAAKKRGLEFTCMNNDNTTALISGGGRHRWVSVCTVWPLHSKWLSKWSEKSASNFALSLNIPLQIQKAAAVGNWWWAASSWQRACSCITSCALFLANIQVTQLTQPLYSSPDLVPCDLIPKLKSPLKSPLRFQTIDEIQENLLGQLMAIGRTVRSHGAYLEGDWEVIVLCTVFLVSSSINVDFS